MKQSLLCLWLWLGLTVPAMAFTQYSAQGIGEPITGATAAEIGMGVIGLATTHPFSFSQGNPALAGELPQTAYSAMLTAGSLEISQHGKLTTRKTAYLPQIRLVVPVFFKLRVGVGLTQRTFVDFHASKTYDYEGVKNGLRRTITLTGGLYALRLTAARQVHRMVSVGLHSDLLFGSIEETRVTEFDKTLTSYTPSIFTPTMEFKGADFTYGIHFRPVEKISIGGMIRPQHTIRARVLNHTDFQSTPIDTTDMDLTLPATYGVGFSINPMPRFRFVGDVQISKWEDFVLGEPLTGLHNTRRLGLGFEWEADPKTETFWGQFPLRVGYTDEPWHIKDADGTINRGYFWSLGTSLDLFRRYGVLDISFTYGRRNSNNLSALQEKIFQLNCTVQGFERWF